IADKNRIAKKVADAVGRMSWRGDDLTFEIADAQRLAIEQQGIELAAIRDELIVEIEFLLERLLHGEDAPADADRRCRAAIGQLPLEPRRRTQMIGMRVRLQDPVDRKFSGRDIFE